jgi:protein disulfide-isomerase A1
MARILYSNRKNEIKLASFDVTRDEEASMTKRYKVNSYPGLIFFIDGVPFEFTGNRKIEVIIAWMR